MVSKVECYEDGNKVAETKLALGEVIYLDDYSDIFEKKIYKVECASDNAGTAVTELNESNYYLRGEDVVQVEPSPAPYIQLKVGEEDFVLYLQCTEFGVPSEFRIRHLATRYVEH